MSEPSQVVIKPEAPHRVLVFHCGLQLSTALQVFERKKTKRDMTLLFLQISRAHLHYRLPGRFYSKIHAISMSFAPEIISKSDLPTQDAKFVDPA